MLHCYNNGPVRWKKKNCYLPGKMQYVNGRVLVIKRAFLSFGGVYTCEGWDDIYRDTFKVSTELIILGKMKIKL